MKAKKDSPSEVTKILAVGQQIGLCRAVVMLMSPDIHTIRKSAEGINNLYPV